MQKIRRACKSHIEQHHTCSLGWWCNYLVGGVLFSSKILSIKRPSRLGCLQNSNTQICKKWKKRVKMSKTGLLGTSFRILESGRPMMGFFFPSWGPYQRPAMTCNLLRLFMPTRSWEYLSDWPQGCLVLPKFCAVFFVKDRGRMFFNHCSFAVTWRLVESFRKDVWKGFTKFCTNFLSMMRTSHVPSFWGPTSTSEKKHQQKFHALVALYFHDENCFHHDPADGLPFLSWGFRSCV